MMERKTHPSGRGWNVSGKKYFGINIDFFKKSLYVFVNSVLGTNSEYKQKQVEALALVKSMKPEAQLIASGVGG